MTSSELKELVKAHFSLVEATPEVTTEEVVEEFAAAEGEAEVSEETFGSIKDINGAFTFEFPGDSPQVGDKVTVVTTEGEKMDAPDGTHEFEDGTKIVTEGSMIKEIMGADGEKALSEEFADEEKVEEEMEEEVIEEEMEESVSIEDIVSEIASTLKEEMGKMKEKMEVMEAKMAEMGDAPAAEATIVTPATDIKPKFNQFSVESAANADKIKLAMELIKKNKK